MRWLTKADVEDGPPARRVGCGVGRAAGAERRNRLLDQENEVLRRAAAYLSQADLPGK
jgi:transposase